MSNALHIAVILGTTRKGAKSKFVANFIYDIGKELDGVEVKLVDPNDFDLPGDGNDDFAKDPKYTEITHKADAFFVVVPEYNHSFPGSLKRLLDSEMKNYIHKPIAFAGVSAGPFGGSRGVLSLVPVVRELGLVATFADVNFSGVGSIFDESGKLIDEKFVDRVKKSFTELIWMAKVLKHGRENVESTYHSS